MISTKKIVPALMIAVVFSTASLSFMPDGNRSFIASAKQGRKGKYSEKPAEEHFIRGKQQLKAEDLDGAVDSFLQATYFARNGYYPEAYYWLGVSYMDKNEDKKAVEAFEKNVQQSIEEPTDTYLALAEIHLRNKRWDECQAALRNIKKYDEKTTQKIEFVYGLMEDKRADSVEYKEPKVMLGKAYDKGNQKNREMAKQAMENERKQHLMSSESHFLRALGQKPWNQTRVWLYYCESKMKQQKWQEALRELNALFDSKVLGNQVRMPLARMHKDIGVCRLAIGDHQGAMDNWRTALDYNKNDFEVWLQIGMLLESERHFSSAVSYYKEFLRLRDGTDDNRLGEVRNRLTTIEHMLNPNETTPTHAKPSQYMRTQYDGIEQQENQVKYQRQKQQQQVQQNLENSPF
ncbi:tetratricopeptide repeat protein [Candidatus Obscuribacterales bacterium]|nr:tetratricopeptide repeat protein [Candidatus Obscuribacterales bacterium]